MKGAKGSGGMKGGGMKPMGKMTPAEMKEHMRSGGHAKMMGGKKK